MWPITFCHDGFSDSQFSLLPKMALFNIQVQLYNKKVNKLILVNVFPCCDIEVRLQAPSIVLTRILKKRSKNAVYQKSLKFSHISLLELLKKNWSRNQKF